MLLHSFYFKTTPLLSSRRNPVTQTTYPAVQFPWLPALTLLGIPAVVIFLWIAKHTLFGGISLGWAALAELVLPLGACIFAAAVFLVPNPMHALLSLLGVFFTTVLFYLAAGIAFVGLVFLIVYVGAVAVLFLFVIMLLNVKSLTSKEALIQHLTQWFSIIAATFLFHQLHSRVFAAVNRTMLSWSARVSSMELTNAEAVLYYIRFAAADINRLVGLYTVHSPTLLVTTLFLLVSLLGAIILATVTTERATAIADIRDYSMPVVAGVSVFIFFYLLPDLFDLFADMLVSVLCDSSTLIVFMSMFTPFSHRGRDVFRPIFERRDGTHGVARKDTYVVLPKFVATPATVHQVFIWKRYKFAGSKKKTVEEIKAVLETLPAMKKESVLQKMRRKIVKYVSSWDTQPRNRDTLFENKQKGFVPCTKTRKYRGEEYKIWATYNNPRWFKKYAKVSSTVAPVVEKWNTQELVSYHQKPIHRTCWLWHWRPERATSLLREQKIHHTTSKQGKKDCSLMDWPIWDWSSYLLAAPLTLFNLGLTRYLRYLYSTRLFPFLYYWAWRGRAFFSVWLFMLFVVPLALVPFPWFLDDYDVLLPQLRALHKQVYWFVDGHILFTAHAPWFLKEVVTILLLYPYAAVKVAFYDTWWVVGISGVYAYLVVMTQGGDFARAELHDSTCNYFRISADTVLARYAAAVAAAELVRRRRHPDKGRLDLGGVGIAAGVHLYIDPSTFLKNISWLDEKVAPVIKDLPSNFGALWEWLRSGVDYIRYTPTWLKDVSDLSFWEKGSDWRAVALLFFLISTAILYSLFSFFIILNWSRVYKNRFRPSLVAPFVHTTRRPLCLDLFLPVYGGV